MSEQPLPPLGIPNQRTAEAPPGQTNPAVEVVLPPSGPSPKESLLVWQQKQRLIDAIKNNDTVILDAGTGTGKTRGGSQIALEAIGPTGHMVVTENLRRATDESAKIVASDMGVKVGEEVGVRNKFTHKESEKTRLLFCPVQSLLIEMEVDKTLEKYDLIFMDEVHKESKENEMCMIKLREIQEARAKTGHPLKIVLTSATADTEKLKDYFEKDKEGSKKNKVEVVPIPGIRYDVTSVFLPPGTPDISFDKLPQAAAEKVRESINVAHDEGNILVFLSGRAQIDKAYGYLKEPPLKDTIIIPYYGTLSREAQDELFKKHVGKRMVVLATNAAQEALTLEINNVIDTCVYKRNEYDPETGREYLMETKTPQDQLTQRKGRVGRNARTDGKLDKYYALATESDWKGREPHERAEMQRTDITPEALLILANGQDPTKFAYVNTPEPSHIHSAMRRLTQLGAVENGKLTEKGKMMATLQLKPQLASLVVSSLRYGCLNQACELAAMLEVYPEALNARDDSLAAQTLAEYKTGGSDMLGMIKLLEEYNKLPQGEHQQWLENRGLWSATMQDASRLYTELLDTITQGNSSKVVDEVPPPFALDRAIYEGFADGKAKKNSAQSYELNEKTLGIDKFSAAQGSKSKLVIAQDINALVKDNAISKRLLRMVHPIPQEVVDDPTGAVEKAKADAVTAKANVDLAATQPAKEELPKSAELELPKESPESPQQPPSQKKPTLWKRITSWFSNTRLGKWLRS